MREYDLIVIGGGRAANLAFAAGREDKRVALIEKDRLGGTCPNRGCVPSKLLIGFAEAARRVREADRHFIAATVDESAADHGYGLIVRRVCREPGNQKKQRRSKPGSRATRMSQWLVDHLPLLLLVRSFRDSVPRRMRLDGSGQVNR